MRRIAIGLAAGLAVWVGSALAAEAQQIQIGPLAPGAGTIHPSTTSTQYKANITPGSTALVDIQLKVYVNSESTPRFVSGVTLLSISGTYLYKKTVSLSGWNLQTGDVLRFHLECWWDPTGQLSSNDYNVTVTGS